MTGASTCRRGIGESFTPYVLRPIVFSPLWLVLKSHAIEGGSRLYKQWVERASWSEEPEELRGALGGERDLELSGFAVSWTPSTWSIHFHRQLQELCIYADFKGVV